MCQIKAETFLNAVIRTEKFHACYRKVEVMAYFVVLYMFFLLFLSFHFREVLNY